ncbi:hypothetical protein CY34DRAFT_369326 [Suillus luteus UH-Slu-Lm8-n1]|uniref:Uncharacterized protein n=1 Tax=Suillus luteus UH-Slu-Lm8-n1 TaxID=930992 RepID=A0A0D0A993_9AGAM|nr:hypothetical protein CY34DRAFT_369326 [Suillus luteus UH-Slu-Lm8-n1]
MMQLLYNTLKPPEHSSGASNVHFKHNAASVRFPHQSRAIAGTQTTILYLLRHPITISQPAPVIHPTVASMRLLHNCQCLNQ